MMRTLFATMLLSTSIFANNLNLEYSYGVDDFMIISDSSHTVGLSGGLYLHYIHDNGMSQKAHLEVSAQYDKLEHDIDHIPVLISGQYRVDKPLIYITPSISLKSIVDFDWKMNTVSGVEQSLKTALGWGVGYKGKSLSFGAYAFVGSNYFEIDDDTPRAYGYSRSELTKGYRPANGYILEFSYKILENIDISSSYRYWQEDSSWREKVFNFEMDFGLSDRSKIGLRVDSNLYNLAPLNIHTSPILPWHQDAMVHLFVKHRF